MRGRAAASFSLRVALPLNLYVTKNFFRSCMHSVYDSSTLKYALDRNTASVSQWQSSGVAKTAV